VAHKRAKDLDRVVFDLGAALGRGPRPVMAISLQALVLVSPTRNEDVNRRLLQKLLTLAVDVRCAVDVLVYFYRHPNVYVTTGWLPARVGYRPEEVEAAIEALTRAGFIVQHRHPSLTAAVLYRLAESESAFEFVQTVDALRWRRQLYLMLRSRERCRRAVAADRRLERAERLLATVRSRLVLRTR